MAPFCGSDSAILRISHFYFPFSQLPLVVTSALTTVVLGSGTIRTGPDLLRVYRGAQVLSGATRSDTPPDTSCHRPGLSQAIMFALPTRRHIHAHVLGLSFFFFFFLDKTGLFFWLGLAWLRDIPASAVLLVLVVFPAQALGWARGQLLPLPPRLRL